MTESCGFSYFSALCVGGSIPTTRKHECFLCLGVNKLSNDAYIFHSSCRLRWIHQRAKRLLTDVGFVDPRNSLQYFLRFRVPLLGQQPPHALGEEPVIGDDDEAGDMDGHDHVTPLRDEPGDPAKDDLAYREHGRTCGAGDHAVFWANKLGS